MSDFIFTLLRERQNMHHRSQYVFQGRGLKRLTEFRHGLGEIRQRSGCSFTVHDLRRTFLTMAAKLEVPHAVIKKLANHSGNSDVTYNYIVQDRERLRFYINKIANEFVLLLGANMDELLLRRDQNQNFSNRQQLILPLSLKAHNSVEAP